MQTLNLAPELRSIFDQDIPRFSDCEYQRRQRALSDVMENASVDHLLVVSAQGTTSTFPLRLGGHILPAFANDTLDIAGAIGAR
jgi:hypothetical protein